MQSKSHLRFFAGWTAALIAVMLSPHQGQAADLPAGRIPLLQRTTAGVDQLDVRLGGGKFGSYELGDVEHEQFSRSLQVKLTLQPENTWDSAFGVPTTSAVKTNDLILVGFLVRGG